MLRIDAHQHFWKYHPVKDAWITEEMTVIKRDFLPEDLQPLLLQNNLDGCIAVQSDQSEQETNLLLGLAEKYDFIKGVVGWIDLQSEGILERLQYYRRFPKLKGFRHIIQGEPDLDFMLNERFRRGISALSGLDFTYDLLIYPQHLPYADELVRAFPEQPFVIDHLAKPNIRDKKISEWERDIRAIARNENVYCKISGMVTEADWGKWARNDFRSYLDVVFDAFGSHRLMFGSDWPVCTLAAEYSAVCELLNDYLSGFSEAEKKRIGGGNAADFYKL